MRDEENERERDFAFILRIKVSSSFTSQTVNQSKYYSMDSFNVLQLEDKCGQSKSNSNSQLDLVSDEETGSEVSQSSNVLSCEETDEVEAKLEQLTEKRYKPDFAREARSWMANYSKPSIHVSVLIEDETGNVSIESHDLHGDKEITNEIQSVSQVANCEANVTSGNISSDEDGDGDGDGDEAEKDEARDKFGPVRKTRTTSSSKPVAKMARRNGIIRSISESDDEEEQFDHVMSLLTSQMEPQNVDHLNKCGQFLSAMHLDTGTHTDTEQIDEDD